MANHVTRPVAEGRATFGSFLWSIAGYHDPEPLPKLDIAYHEEAIATMEAMTPVELELHVAQLRAESMASNAKYNANRAKLIANYSAMQAKVEAWNPPLGCEGLKASMSRELTNAWNADVHGEQNYMPTASPGDWRDETVAFHREAIERVTARHAAECAEIERRNARLAELVRAVPVEEAT